MPFLENAKIILSGRVLEKYEVLNSTEYRRFLECRLY